MAEPDTRQPCGPDDQRHSPNLNSQKGLGSPMSAHATSATGGAVVTAARPQNEIGRATWTRPEFDNGAPTTALPVRNVTDQSDAM